MSNCLGAAGSTEAEAALERLLFEERLDTGRALVGQTGLLATPARIWPSPVRTWPTPSWSVSSMRRASCPTSAARSRSSGPSLRSISRGAIRWSTRLVVDLVLEGRAESAGGATLVAGALVGDEAAVTERLGRALLRLASIGRWFSSESPEPGGTFRGLFAGRSQSGTARMLTSLTGRTSITETPDALGHWELDLLADAGRRLADGLGPLASLELMGGMAHVQLEAIRTGAEGLHVHYLRPSGKLGALPADEFLQRVASYSYER